MERKINARMILVGMLSLLLTASMGSFVFHRAFDTQVREDVRQTAEIFAQGYEYTGDDEFLMGAAEAGEHLRLTLISSEGEVLFESLRGGTLENHMDRPEVKAAMKEGSGEAVRTSQTMGCDTYYYAVRLTDGSVLRLGMEVSAMNSVYDQALPALILIGIFVFFVSMFLSLNLTRTLIRPITAMAESIDEIERHVPYQELAPFAEAVARHQRRLLENERMRQEFTSNVSHELKTPLTSISGYAEMIETGMAKEEDVKEFASRIRLESRRLLRLIGDILRLGELDYPAREAEREEVRLDRLAHTVAERLQWQAQQAYITVKTDLEPVLLCGDESMLSEICYNLCDNAIRYNRPGGTVWLSVAKRGEDAVLTVRDDGIGIPLEAQDRVFERFYRVDKSRSKETGGTGLGLAIVKHAVSGSGGKIHLKSAPGKGTEIVVTLPAGRSGTEAKAQRFDEKKTQSVK